MMNDEARGMIEQDEKPSWLVVPEEEHGIDDLSGFIVPPRIKVVQPLSQAPYDDFDKGDAILTPQLIKLIGEGETFHVTPLFFFAEWCLWNPLETKGMLPAIRERTLDPQDQMVALARDPKKRETKCPEKPDKMMRYVEHLNFMCVIKDIDGLEETPIIMSFDRAEHRYGSSFAALIRMRKAPIWGGNYSATSAKRENNKGIWWGLSMANPTEASGIESWVAEEEAEVFRRLHNEFKEAHASRTIQVDYGDESMPEGETGGAEDTGEF